jgi:hypothetical protein
MLDNKLMFAGGQQNVPGALLAQTFQQRFRPVPMTGAIVDEFDAPELFLQILFAIFQTCYFNIETLPRQFKPDIRWRNIPSITALAVIYAVN